MKISNIIDIILREILIIIIIFISVITCVFLLCPEKYKKTCYPYKIGCCMEADCVWMSGKEGEGWCTALWNNGNLYQNTLYKNNKIIEIREYDENGKLIYLDILEKL